MTREGILEAAAKIFSEKGFHATSMHDIAEAVNLQKASLYYHFDSKQEILVAILNYGLDLLNNKLEAVLTQSCSPDEKLRQAMVTYLETIGENQNLSAVLLLELRSLDPKSKDLLAERREKFERVWSDLIIEGKRAGIFTDVDPSLTGRAFLGVMNWTVTWYRRDGKRSAREIADMFADLLLKGLLVS